MRFSGGRLHPWLDVARAGLSTSAQTADRDPYPFPIARPVGGAGTKAESVDGAIDGPTDLFHLILQTATAHPNRPALSGPRGRPLSYRDLTVAVLSVAKSLRRLGFGPGQRLLYAMPPHPRGIVLALGAVAAGGSVVFAEPGARPELLATRTMPTGPAWLAGQSSVLAVGPFHRLRLLRSSDRPPVPAGHDIRTLRAGPWRPGLPRGTVSIRGLQAGRAFPNGAPLPGPAGSAAEVVLFATDQETVVHTQGSLVAAVSMLGAQFQIGQRSRILSDQLLVGLTALVAGAHWRMPTPGLPPRAEPARFAKTLARATHTVLGPADLSAVLGAISDGLAPSPRALAHVVVSGPAVGLSLLARTVAVLPQAQVLTVYGKPEIMPIAVTDGRRRLEAVDATATLAPGVEARIAPDGELIVRGPNLARSRLWQPPMTEFATGDLAELNGRSLVLLGRKHHVILRGTTAIAPELYEPAIAALPGVRHAVLIGVPDETGFERVVLVLQPAGQPVNDAPLAGEPKQSHSRTAEGIDAQQISVLVHHPLATAVTAALPSVLDATARPDQVVVLSAFPAAGPVSDPGPPPEMEPAVGVDRAALRRLLADLPVEDAEPLLETPNSVEAGALWGRRVTNRRRRRADR